MTQVDRPQDSFPKPLSLQGRTVVITGGTRGIGRMMAEAIAVAGANVVIAGRDGATVEAAVATVATVAGLVTQAQAMQELAARELAIQTLAAELGLTEGTEVTAKQGPKLGLGSVTVPDLAPDLAPDLSIAPDLEIAPDLASNLGVVADLAPDLAIAPNLASNLAIAPDPALGTHPAAAPQGGVAQGRVWGMACDVQDLAQVEALAQGAIDRFGSLDVWFNNAAVTHPFGPVLEIPYDRWRQVIETNLVGTYHGTIAALKQMIPQQKGTIINFLGAGTSGDVANGYLSAYTASKAGIQRFTQVAADDYKSSGVKICGFNPGLVPTDLTVNIEPLNAEAKRRLQFLRFGLRWFATPPEKITEMALKLAMDSPEIKNGKFYRCLPDLRLNLQRGFQNTNLKQHPQPPR